MKAAVIYQKGDAPQYTNFPEPVSQQDNELLVTVKAVAIKNFDKGQASGTHYSSSKPTSDGIVPGGDGVCLLEDGSRIYAIGVSGMLAEKATIDKRLSLPIPEGLDDITAAALPNAVFGAAMGLKYKADIQQGDVVLINGATGFTGRVAVQIAKYYGASKVIVTGRNQQSLRELAALGADETLSVLLEDDQFASALKVIHIKTPIDIVIDYLWGHPAELIFAVLKGNGGFTNRIRYVSVGSMSGDLLQLSAACLRSVDLSLTGSGLGSWSKARIAELFSIILPEMFQLALEGKLVIETISMPLTNIASLWQLEVKDGKRLVVTV